MCKSITRFGEVGMGNAFKLIYNTMGVIQVVAAVEGMYAAEAAGIDLEAAAKAFSGGNTGSGHVGRHTKYMATGKHEDPVHFSGRNRLKDVSYGVEFIEKIGAQSRLGHTAAEVLNQMIDLGMGDRNDSELFDALRKIHGKH
jgi:3-hydroxyisobutyrate dehydrogenase-like beta-hydroxyacid dehydrogenase